jgi:20S proteasome subunit alpha 7
LIYHSARNLSDNYHACYSIYAAHDESKDKEFELEISWVSTTDSEGRFAPVPRELVEEAENKAKEDLDADMED